MYCTVQRPGAARECPLVHVLIVAKKKTLKKNKNVKGHPPGTYSSTGYACADRVAACLFLLLSTYIPGTTELDWEHDVEPNTYV